MSVALDPQIGGVFNDGSEEGIVRASIDSGFLVPVPFKYPNHVVAAGASVFMTEISGANHDGSNLSFAFNVAAAGTGSTYRIRHWFWGTSYGVRFNPKYEVSSGGNHNFSVVIDGVAYEVDRQNLAWDTATDPTNEDWLNGCIVATGLEDRRHLADIVCTPHPSLGAGQQIYGFLADSKYYAGVINTKMGYFRHVAVPTTKADIAINSQAKYNGKGLRKIYYCNTSGGTRVVQLKFAGDNSKVIWRKSIADGETAEFDPGCGITLYAGTQGITHEADAAGVQALIVVAQ